MSTYNIYKGNILVLPKFDILFFLNSGKSIFLDDKYTRWFFLFSFACSAVVLFNFTKMAFRNLRRFINNMKVPTSISNKHGDKFVLVLGFGDTNASITISKFFSKLGYNILAISEESVIEFRNNNKKNIHDGIDRLETRFIQLSYEEFFYEFKQKLENKYANIKINNVFECSLWREISTEDSNLKNEANFNFELVKSKISEFHKILNSFKNYFDSCKFFFFDHYVKHSFVHHKLLADFKYDLMNNFLYNNKTSVESLIRIKLRNKFNKMSEDNFEKIYLNLEKNTKHQNYVIE